MKYGEEIRTARSARYASHRPAKYWKWNELRPVRPLALALVLTVLALASGCGGSGTPTGTPQSSTAVPRITPPPPRSDPQPEPEPDVRPQPPPARHPVGPWLEYQVANSDHIEAKAYLKLLNTPGFDSVLELSSYDSPDHEQFPSLHIRARTRNRSLSDLLLQKLPAQLFLMIEKDGNLIHNQPSQNLEIVITEIDGKNVRGTFSGQVHDIDSSGNGPITGRFQAVVE